MAGIFRGVTYETSVQVEGTNKRVQNIGLLEDKRTIIMISCAVLLSGVILFAAGVFREGKTYDNAVTSCWHCKAEAEVSEDEELRGEYECPGCHKINTISTE